jgi:hypothetical protein
MLILSSSNEIKQPKSRFKGSFAGWKRWENSVA